MKPESMVKEGFLTPKQIAEQLGIVSATGLPHRRAVGEILRKMEIYRIKNANGGWSYPEWSKKFLRQWLYEKNMPEEISDKNGKLQLVFYVPCSKGKPVLEEMA